MTGRRSGYRRQRIKLVDEDRRDAERRQRPDRRGSVRLPIETWIEEVSGDDIYFRRTGNVSESGVFFDKAIPHPVGTMLSLKFSLPGTEHLIKVKGEVINISAEGLGMGIKFLSIEEDGAEHLRIFMNQLVSNDSEQ